MRFFFYTIGILTTATLLHAADSPGEVAIFRDAWGVPHIYGDTEEAAAYGHGYTQAEDRLDDILTLYTIVQGTAARAFGPKWLQEDHQTHLARHPELSHSRYPDLAPRTRRLIEFYTRGILDYIKTHPEEMPEWATPPKPYHVVALYRSFIWDWPWGQALGDLKRTGSHISDGRGSNQWVVSKSRSAEGGTIALIDPHLTWTPANRFYESHVHGGDLNFYGFSIIGTPFMVLGHTNTFSIAATTGGPDCADIYEEKINPDNPRQYFYDGDWREIRTQKIEIEVRGPEGRKKEARTIERTHHGPIVKRLENRAFVAKTAYDEQVGFVDQLLKIILSQNLGEFLQALGENQILPQNIMYADIHGNTYYIRGGRVPVRPEGYRWDRPVPGWTSKSEWQGIHPLSDLVQIPNPGVGYMQNCNISPGTMMPNSPLQAEHYASYIYNSPPNRTNARGQRALQLLGAHKGLTLDDAFKIAVDTYVIEAPHWQQALNEAYKAHTGPFAHLQEAVEILSTWNGYMDIDSPGATLFRFWMRACKNVKVPTERIRKGESLAGVAQRNLLKTLDKAVSDLKSRTQSINVPWGDLHRAGRAGETWPVAGSASDGISTLRAVNSSAPNDKGIFQVKGGQFCTTIVLLKPEGIVSYSATPYGQSNHTDSPHFTDQGHLLFAKSRLKPTWYGPASNIPRIESKNTFKVPPSP